MMFTSLKNRTKGFTLIELLVVIAIIGILSSVVLASLSTARQKSRDAKRISDVGQLMLANELYFDSNQRYPVELAAGASPYYDASVTLTAPLVPSYLPKYPAAPLAGEVYYYRATTASDSTYTACTGVLICLGYNLSSSLERNDNPVRNGDSDSTWGAGASQLTGADAAGCEASLPATRYCYDMRP